MTSYDDGDWRIPYLDVAPYDGTTTVALTVVAPSGTTTTPTVTESATVAGRWEGAGYELSAGEWIERWTVTGTGKGRQRTTIQVAPDPAAVPTGTRVYATTADYAWWLRAAPPTGARRALAAASREVDGMLLCAVYDVDADGYPTDPDHIVALRDATCAQADYAAGQGDPYGVGSDRITSVSLGSLSYSRAAPPAGQTAAPRWSQTALDILSAAGLTGHEPRDRW